MALPLYFANKIRCEDGLVVETTALEGKKVEREILRVA